MLKRVLSMLLVCVMLVGMLPMQAFAEEADAPQLTETTLSAETTEPEATDETPVPTETEETTVPKTTEEKTESEDYGIMLTSEDDMEDPTTGTSLKTTGLTFDVEDPDGYVTISFTDNGIRPEDATISDWTLYGTAVGTIVPATEVPYKKGDSIATVTVRLLDAMGLEYDSTGTVKDGFYLSALEDFELNGTYYARFGEFDAGNQSGWCVRLNNWHINQGTSAIEVEDEDVISWLYTCQFGADIGADYSSKSADITNVILTDSSLSLEEGEDGTYTCEVPAGTSSIAFEVELENYASVVTVTVDGTKVKYRPNKAINVRTSSTIVISTELEYMDASNGNAATTYTDSMTIQLTEKPANRAPVVSGNAPSNLSYTVGEEIIVTLSALFTDADGDDLTYHIQCTALGLDQDVTGSVFTGTIPTAGDYAFVVTASDGEYSVSHTVTVAVTEASNNAPAVVEGAPTEMTAYVGEEISVDLSKFFTDADGDTLTYNVKIGDLNVNQTLEGSTFTGTIPTAGTYDVQLTANDGKDSTSHTVTLTVTEKVNTVPNIKAFYQQNKLVIYGFKWVKPSYFFEDADGDSFTVTVTCNGENVALDSTGEFRYDGNAAAEYIFTANDGVADSASLTAYCYPDSMKPTVTFDLPDDSPLVLYNTSGSSVNTYYYILGAAENDTFAFPYSLNPADSGLNPYLYSSNSGGTLTFNSDGTITVSGVTSYKESTVYVTCNDGGYEFYPGSANIRVYAAGPAAQDVTVTLPEHADNTVSTTVANAFGNNWIPSFFDFTLSDPSVADVVSSGSYDLSITPKKLGTTTVTATFKGDDSIACTFTVTVTGRSLQIKDQPGSDDVIFADGKTVQLEVLGAAEGETFTWTSSDESVATVNENGLVTLKSLGKSYITATSSLSTEDAVVKASMYLQVKESGKVYLDEIAITDYTYFDGFISAKSGFNSAQLTYNWTLGESRYSYNKLAFTPYFDDENLDAVLHYQVSGGEYQTMALTSGTPVSIANGLNPGDNVVKIDVAPTDDEENVTTYTFHIFRPYNPTKTITGMTVYPDGGTALSYPTYKNYKEGTIFRYNSETDTLGYTGWSSTVYTYKTYIFGSRTSTISLTPKFGYTNERVMIYVDGVALEEAVTNWKSSAIPIDEDGAVITFHANSEKYHAEKLAAGVEDPFAEPEAVYTLYVETVEPLGIDAQILSAELSIGDFYKPGFKSSSYTTTALLPADQSSTELTFTVPDGLAVYKGYVNAANKLTATGQDEDGNNIYTVQMSIAGTAATAYSTTNIILQVTDENGDTGMSQYAFNLYRRGTKDIYPDSIVDYLCLGSQYTNQGSYGTMPERTLKAGGDTLSLGNFGGYIVYKYDTPIQNNPNNSYGVDFVIYGNSFGDGAHEPGYVQVSQDGKTWYTLAGSDHYEDHNDWNYSMTYTNVDGKSSWTNSDGESGTNYSYPIASAYPYFNWTEALEQSMTVTGPRLNSSAEDAYGSAAAVLPVFGYVDVNTNGTINGTSNNPYNHPGTLVAGGDQFDLDWAVDAKGLPVSLDSISYIRVATASSIYAGAIGEKSTEVTAVNRVTNTAAEAVGVTSAPTAIKINGTDITVPANGGVQNVTVSEGEELAVAVIASEDANIYIGNTGAAERTYTAIPETGIVRIIVQEGEKEPYICYLTITEAEEKIGFKSIEIYKSESDYLNGGEPLVITPDADISTYEYYITSPDYLKQPYIVCTPSATTLKSNCTYSVSASSYSLYGTALSDGVLKRTAAYYQNKYVWIKVCDSSYSEIVSYKLYPSGYTTLSGLTVDGVMDKTFDRDTNTYHVYADSSNESITITPTAYNSAYTVTVNGETVTSGAAYDLKYNWDENGKMLVQIQVSYEGYTTSTYTVELEQMPRNDQPFIMTQPVDADYIQNETAKALSVIASANGDMTYQWYANTTDSNENGTAIEGATAAEHVPSTETVGTVYYYCVVTNTGKTEGNVATSEAARVTVDPDPTPVVLLTNPGSAMPEDGYDYPWATGYVYAPGAEATTLTVNATSAVEGGTWSYQWYRTTNRAYNINSYTTLSGETGTSYTPDTSLSLANNTGSYYWCKVSYTYKGKTYSAKSTTGETYTIGEGDDAVTYDVNAAFVFIKVDEAATPTFTVQPASANYVQGDAAVALSITATRADGGKLTYQWYTNTENSTEGATAIEGATKNSYNPGTMDETGSKYYYCVVTNTVQGHTASAASDIAELKVKTTQELVGDRLKGSGTASDPYKLATAEDYQAVADLVAQGVFFTDMYLEQTANITLPAGWAGIGGLKAGTTATGSGKNMNVFSGTLDGGGYTLTFATGSMPLFKYVREATVQNLNISGTYIAEDGLVSDYVVDYGSDGSYNSGTGGSYAVGCPDTIDITNVTIKSGTTIKGSGFLSGFASGGNTVNITGCIVESGVKIGWDADAGTSSGTSKIGSFGGDFNGTITNSKSAATVYGGNYVGGIVGAKGQSMGPYKVVNCSFTGEVIATGTMVGGIAGGGYTSSSAPNSPCATIENCYVAGKVTGSDKVGGVFGGEAAVSQCWANGVGYIRNNHFYGTVTATAGTAGGIIGYMHSLDRYNVIENNFYLDTCGAAKGIGVVNSVDLTTANYGRDDDPLGEDAHKLTTAKTASAFADGTVQDLLNAHEASLHNWAQGSSYPTHSSEAIVYKLEISGDYKTEFAVGGELDLTGMVLTAFWSNGSTTTPALADTTITGFDNTTQGEQTISIAYGAAKAQITITVLKPSEETITVTFSILGDAVHNSTTDGDVHTLDGGNLTTWVAAKEYTVSASSTVLSVLEAVLTENGMTWSNESGNYIQSITRNGVTLGEFTNGQKSGWMYTLNGVHSDLGVAQQYLSNADVVVFHYTDDYSQEDGRAAEDVEALISDIGTVTLDSEEKINAARAAYEKLTDAQKEQVENYDVLLAAEQALAELKAGGASADIQNIYTTTGDYLAALDTPTVSSINGEWRVIGLARSGRDVADGYYSNVVSYVQSKINANEQLNAYKSTDNSRLILALTAIGKDVTDVGGHNLLEGLTSMSYVTYQGVNGPIWALLAFDSHAYTIPAGDVTRDGLVEAILNAQLSDGGWALSGTASDADMTGMALQALAPYYNKNTTVKTAVDKALSWLSNVQRADGSFAGTDGVSAESLAQIITALTSLGINPEEDARFIKNGLSAIDALAEFYVEGGGFKHILSGSLDMMATEQSYYALASYFRLLKGKTALYDMTDVTIHTAALDKEAAEAVEVLIEAIGTVTDESEAAITAARNAYDALTDIQKALVSNLSILEDAEKALAELKKTAEDEAAASAVEKLITDIGNVTLDREQAIKAAREAYDKLSDLQKTLVDNAAVLTNAENKLAALKVDALIDAIGSNITASSKTAIQNARNAYNALSEEQKALVTKYQTLVNAEAKLKELNSTISVSFTLLGCYKHGSGETSVHTLAGGNLSTWISATTIKVSVGATVKDVFEKALTAAGMSWSNPTGNYVESINGIGEFTNGKNSGWMYTLNGTHPNLGVAQQTVVNGDVIVFHYTDDYTKEDSSQGYKNYSDEEAANAVEKLIKDIGTPITLDSEAKIVAAREAYEKLTAVQKKLVENYEDLVAAEKALAELKNAVGEDIYKNTGDYLESLGTPDVGAVGGEWLVIGLARSGRDVSAVYYDKVVAYVNANINANEQLHSNKSTDNSRVILALTAIGKDVTDVDGHNLLAGLTNMDYVCKQGINGPIWALIAFDSGNYPIPEGNVTREKLIETILAAQLADGGWALSGSTADPDMTGMAVQALAPYCDTNAKVKNAVEEAVWAMSKMQSDNGSYSSVDGASSESIAQIITALSALGIDADTDARFIKNGISAWDALLTYYVEGGGFRHILSGKLDGMATEQAYYAMTAYYRMLNNKTALYDMTDVIDLGGDVGVEETTESTEAALEMYKTDDDVSFPWWILVLVISAGAITVLIVNRKKIFKLL